MLCLFIYMTMAFSISKAEQPHNTGPLLKEDISASSFWSVLSGLFDSPLSLRSIYLVVHFARNWMNELGIMNKHVES